MGLAVSGAVFINKATEGLVAILPDLPVADIQLALAGTSNAFLSSLSAELRQKCTDTIVASMANVFIPVYVGAAVSLVLSVCFTVSTGQAACFRAYVLTLFPKQRKLFKDAVAIAA